MKYLIKVCDMQMELSRFTSFEKNLQVWKPTKMLPLAMKTQSVLMILYLMLFWIKSLTLHNAKCTLGANELG